MTDPTYPEPADQIIVKIDRDLEDIVPGFLANRENDLPILHQALAQQEFKTIQMLGHRMKGDGGGYGFDKITEIGGKLELAAGQLDHETIEKHLVELEDFLTRLRVVYQ